MRIAIIHNQFSGGGGMEAYLETLICGFLEAGDEVHIHTYQVAKEFAARYPFCRLHRKNYFFLPRKWRKYMFLRHCNRKIDRYRYDLTLALTRTGCVDVAVVGGVHPASVAARPRFRHPLRRLHDYLETRFEGMMFNRVPVIMAHSKAVAEEIATWYPWVKAEKILVVYPPVNTLLFSRLKGEAFRQAREKYCPHREIMYLLFPSMGHRRKGLEELLTAFSRLDPARFHLLVVGETLRGFGTIPGNVTSLGYVDNLSSLYSVADYTVLPSNYEPFGLAVMESLHCGTPVMVTRHVGASELLGDDEGIILEDNRPETLVRAISGLRRRVVKPGCIERYGLGIDRHIERIKSLADYSRQDMVS